MTEPKRLADAASAELEPLATLATLVRSSRATDVLSHAEISAQLDAAEVRIASQARRMREAVAFCASAAVAALVVSAVMPPKQVAFTVDPGAAWLAPRAGEPIHLTRGTLHGGPSAKPVQLQTPHAWLEWTDARFRVAVDTAGTSLFVEQGTVRWRASGGEQRVGQGYDVHAPAPIDVPAAFQTLATPPRSQCTETEASPRAACLRELARGDGLKAQNALFEWALLQREGLHAPERAVEGWREYATRFPGGALAPEASVGLIADLIRLSRYDEALAAAQQHRARFPDVFPLEVAGLEAKLAAAASKGRP